MAQQNHAGEEGHDRSGTGSGAVRAAWLTWAAIGMAALVCSTAASQTQIETFTGPPFAAISNNFAAAGDLNGDQVVDVVTGHGKVWLFSGADGSIFHTINQPSGAGGFGNFVDAGADVVGPGGSGPDGVPDILVGAQVGNQNFNGRVYVFSGAGFSQERVHIGTAFQNLGTMVAFLDDLTGDGVPEYGAGATYWVAGQQGSPQPGRAYIFDGASGAQLYSLTVGQVSDQFGGWIEPLGLINGDSVPDFAVGAGNASIGGKLGNGAVYIYSGATGTLIRVDSGPADGDTIGRRIGQLDDIDESGVVDYVTTWSPGTTGALVFSGETGGVLTEIMSPPPLLETGSVTSVRDVDGDGHRDVLLSNIAIPRIPPGYASIVSSVTGEMLFRIDDPLDESPGYPGFVAGLGDGQGKDVQDPDNDGLEDIGVMDLTDAAGGGGSIYVYSRRSLYAHADEISAAARGIVPFDVNAGVPHSGGTYFFLVSVTPLGATGPCSFAPCGSTGSPIGPVPVYLPMCVDPVTTLGLQLVNQTPFVNMYGTLGASTGSTSAPVFDMSSITLPPAAVCFSFYFAYVAKPADGGPWDLASSAEAVLIVP